MTSENISSNKLSLRGNCLTLIFKTLSIVKLLLLNSVLLKDNYYILILCLSNFLRCFFLIIKNNNLSESLELLTKFLSLFSAFFILLMLCLLMFSLFSSLVSITFLIFLISLFLNLILLVSLLYSLLY